MAAIMLQCEALSCYNHLYYLHNFSNAAKTQSRTLKSFHRLVIGPYGPNPRYPRLLRRDVEPVGEDQRPIRAEIRRRQEPSMNHSIYSADRSTHLKIVVVALVAGIAVAGFGIAARTNSDDGHAQTA